MIRMFTSLVFAGALLLGALTACTHRYQPAATDLPGPAANDVHAGQGDANGANHN